MPKHVHAELMKQYAEDAMTTNEPWKLWEYDPCKGGWRSLSDNPVWDVYCKYRRKEKYKIQFDDNLNDVGWDFNDNCYKHGVQVSAVMFNSCKSILKGVIEGYLDRMSKEEVEELLKGK